MYTSTYSAIVTPANTDANGVPNEHSNPCPSNAHAIPHHSACVTDTRPAATGRSAVRVISASVFFSHAWLNTLAAMHDAAVPASDPIRPPHVHASAPLPGVLPGVLPGATASAKPSPAVITTIRVMRGLVSAR